MKNNILKESGFSLIEILVAIAVAAVVFPAVITLMSFSTFTTSQGETYTKAYTVAQKEMENVYSMKRTDFDTVVTNCPVTEGVFTKCITVTDLAADEKKVNIKVSWDERGKTQDVVVESIITNI